MQHRQRVTLTFDVDIYNGKVPNVIHIPKEVRRSIMQERDTMWLPTPKARVVYVNSQLALLRKIADKT